MSSPSTGAAAPRVLVLGGTSEIALAIVREMQRRAPREVLLAGRDLAALEAAAGSLRAAGCDPVGVAEVDALDTGSHEALLAAALERLGGCDIVIVAVGVLGERGGLPIDVAGALAVMQTNTVGAGSLLIQAGALLRRNGGGRIVVLSSVAAELARRGNAVYGASKAGLDSLAQALGDDLHEEGVEVLVVRPGFVRTRMTEGLEPAPLATTPEAVAVATVDGLERGAHTVWAPAPLRAVMMAMRLLPRPLLRRIKQ